MNDRQIMSSFVHLFIADFYVLEYAIFQGRMFGIVPFFLYGVPRDASSRRSFA